MFGNVSQTVNWDVGWYINMQTVKWNYKFKIFGTGKKEKERLEKPIKTTEEDKDVKPDQLAASADGDSTQSTRR